MAKVLIADDDSDILDLVRFKLEASGHQVVPTVDGDAALHALRSESFDIALLDIQMPHKTGLEVVEIIRTEDATKDLPVVLLTARARGVDMEMGFAAGANDYIVKPFSPRELVTRVDAVLTGTSGSP